MDGFDPEQYDVDFLDRGGTVHDFIDNKIKELSLVGCSEPFHVANLDNLVKKYVIWCNNLPRVKPFYAVKCNDTPTVIGVLSALGTGFDCASKAEIQLALSLGVTPDRIIYAHTIKAESHIKYARTHGVQMMTFDNQEELSKIARCHARAKLVLRITVDDSKAVRRLNTKFGASLDSAGRLLQRAGELGLDVVGVSFHVGCQCTDSRAYRQAIADARQVFNIASLMGFQLSLLDIGGGFSGNENFKVKFEEVAATINLALDDFFPVGCGVQIIAEPGRYYVESAFTLAVNVIAKKVIMEEAAEHNRSEEGVPDRVMMYYVNDGVYGSLSFLINDPTSGCISPYLQRAAEGSERRYRSVIWGPTCDSLDKLTDSCLLPELQVGEWLLMDNTGAYTVCLATDFNGFEKAHVYSVVTPETWRALNSSHA
ncbi:ornithine decarboxylase-like [Myripristis murdjan]|uniref:ornithine decarboxylase-like n=1 Tax=Myripristis murdjan TaxID=586833 RepID=UPI0011761B7D|nr:ornithine decarboxylase-like [Myripristis murdjan]